MNTSGITVGIIAFLLIGIFHVIVIKAEYYFTKNIWPVFLAAGCLSLGASLCLTDMVASSAAAVFGITCLWSIKELFQQEQRVKKGWFPENPRRAEKKPGKEWKKRKKL